MSLLNKATIITTPTAQSNGKLHSIKGGSVADFDVVRGSSATRVNAEGLIEDVRILSGELVTNGDFSDGSTGWTVVNGTITDKYNASMTAYQGGIKITPFTKVGTFKVVFDLVVTSGSCKFDAGGGNDQIYSTSGTKEIIVTDTNKFEFNAFNLGWVGTLDNVSVIEITHDTDIPRIDYTTGEGVILTEPQSTNLITYSEDFSNVSWTKLGLGTGTTSVITSNYAISPDGTQNASRLVCTLNNGGTTSDQSLIYALDASNTSQSISVYMKSNNGSNQNIYFANTVGADDTVVVTNEWKRFEFNHSTSNHTFSLGLRGNTGADNTADILIWAAQSEALPYSTSYIPTSGAIATRLADAVTGAGDSSTFNSAEGVLYAEIAALASPVSSPLNITLSDGTTSNYVRVELYQDGKVYGNIYDGTSVAGSFAINQSNYNKVALQYSASGSKLYVNGIGVGFASKVFSASTLNSLQFSHANSSIYNFYGKTKTIAVFSEALTDEELTCLTTI